MEDTMAFQRHAAMKRVFNMHDAEKQLITEGAWT
jgi:hypothetical protein